MSFMDIQLIISEGLIVDISTDIAGHAYLRINHIETDQNRYYFQVCKPIEYVIPVR